MGRRCSLTHRAVMQEILQAGSVADIAIEDPPLEEVIAYIYGQQA